MSGEGESPPPAEAPEGGPAPSESAPSKEAPDPLPVDKPAEADQPAPSSAGSKDVPAPDEKSSKDTVVPRKKPGFKGALMGALAKAEEKAAKSPRIVKPGEEEEESAFQQLRKLSKSMQLAKKFSKSFTSIRSRRSKDSIEGGELGEEKVQGIPPGYFYNTTELPALEKPTGITGYMPENFQKHERTYGFDFWKRYNVKLLPNNECVFSTGQNAFLYNYATHEYRTIAGFDGGGIGCTAVDPKLRYLALGECCRVRAPNVYIYELASSRLYRVLRKGTERGYACIAFSPHTPEQVATLGIDPDYLLTIWDWTQEKILLKCKAFGQEVYGVRWCWHPGQLLTYGTGHIRFWKMARTFTGLKLQGAIGKFGQTDLSDVTCAVDLEDGRVISGSEYGKILLWAGVFVSCELVREGPPGDDGKPARMLPHQHPGGAPAKLEVCFLDPIGGKGEKKPEYLVTGGEDGFLRWWPLKPIDFAEADYDSGNLEVMIPMGHEVQIPPEDMHDPAAPLPADIMHVTRSSDDRTWLIQDRRNGVVWKFDRDSQHLEVVLRGHSMDITGCLNFPRYRGLTVTAGTDGTLRGYNTTLDTRQKAEVLKHRFADLSGKELGISCLTQLPAKADPRQRSMAVGFADGTVRVVSLTRGGFELQQALKAHNGPVGLVACAPDGDAFCSVSGKEIFFFELQGGGDVAHFAPLGFVTMPSTVRQVVWNDENGRLLACLDNGTLVELVRPAPDVPNQDSYAIDLEMRVLLPDIPDPNAKVAAEPVEGEEAKKDEDEEEAVPEEPVERDLTCSAHAALYLAADSVLFAGTGLYAGHLWETSFAGAPVANTSDPNATPFASETVSRTALPNPVSLLAVAPGDNFLLAGFQTGQAWAMPLANLDVHLEVLCGDMVRGGVSGLCMTEDESALIASAHDGSLTVTVVNPEACKAVAAKPSLLTSSEDASLGQMQEDAKAELRALATKSAPEYRAVSEDQWDLPVQDQELSVPEVAADAMSIEEAKLRAEAENAKAAAERQKKRVRERVKELRDELEQAMQRNQLLPPRRQLRFTGGDDEKPPTFVDPGYIQSLTQEMEDKMVLEQEHLNWDIEYNTKRLLKLEERFLKGLDFEVATVCGFSKSAWVQTFRTPALSAELQGNLAKLHALITHVDESDSEGAEEKAAAKKDAAAKKQAAEREQPELSSAQMRELRRQLRQKRQADMLALEKAKPGEQDEDPRDLEAIAAAEATAGDYTLKTSAEYQVPENARMNAEKKRRQMCLLEESMHAIRTEFNERVLALRAFRVQVKEEVVQDLRALFEIDTVLGSSTQWVRELFQFHLSRLDPIEAASDQEFIDALVAAVQQALPGEYPERRFDISADDYADFCARHSLHQEPVPEELKEEKAPEPVEEGLKPPVGVSAFASALDVSGAAKRRAEMLFLQSQTLGLKDEAPVPPFAGLVRRQMRERLWFEKEQREKQLRQVIETFDHAIESLSREKSKLESDLKNAEIKLLVLYEELLMLSELEEKDEQLLAKSNKCRLEKTSIMHQIKECQEQLSEKKVEIETWQGEEASLQAEFTDLVGENSPYLGALLRIYKKKVKRSKRKRGAGEEEEADFDEEESDEDEDEDLESDDDDEMEEDACPGGCDMSIYESVLELREKRLEMEDALQEIQKAVDELKKTHTRLLQQEKQIDKEQKGTEGEIQSFQTEKQRKLNQVDISFTLRISQVQAMQLQLEAARSSKPPPAPEDEDEAPVEEDAEDSPPAVAPTGPGLEVPPGYVLTLPPGLDGQVVFTGTGLGRLMSRITELHQEKALVHQNYKKLKKDFVVRNRDRKQAEQAIEELQRKFDDIQLLKFGQVIDLELLERSGGSKYIQELTQKVEETELTCRKQLASLAKKIEGGKSQLQSLTKENTTLMEQITQMGYSQLALDQALNARIANVTVNDEEPMKEIKDVEKERMKELLTLQAKEIATLQAEIGLFRKKGGHIYTTVTANRLEGQ